MWFFFFFGRFSFYPLRFGISFCTMSYMFLGLWHWRYSVANSTVNLDHLFFPYCRNSVKLDFVFDLENLYLPFQITLEWKWERKGMWQNKKKSSSNVSRTKLSMLPSVMLGLGFERQSQIHWCLNLVHLIGLEPVCFGLFFFFLEPSVNNQKTTFSLEEKSKSSKKRVHYMKFAKGKRSFVVS